MDRPDPAAIAAPHATPAEAEVLGLVLEQTRRFVAREVDAAAIEQGGKIPRRVIEAAGGAGLFGLTIPESHGGLGLSLKATCGVIQTVARTDRSVAVMLGLHAGLGTRGLISSGPEALRDQWLPLLASGECVASFAATEAQAGSDLAAVKCTGVGTDDGGFTLDGEKVYVTNGGFAGLFTVLARTPGEGGRRGHALVCVPREADGVEVGPEEDKLGIRASSTVTVTFNGVKVPAGAVLGARGRGLDLAHDVLAWGRTIMSAGCVGTAEAALSAALDYVTTRRQFGKPIGDFASVKGHVAAMAARTYAMEALVRDVGDHEARGEALGDLSAAAKVFCSEGAFIVTDTALQLHGALGFIESVGVARMLRDCRITRIFEGANDVLLVRLGAALVAVPSAPVSLDRAGAPTALLSGLEAHDGLARVLSESLASVRKEHGVRAVHRQLALQGVARAEVCRRAAAAALARAQGEASDDALALGALAADILCREGERHALDARRGLADETQAARVADALYASKAPQGEVSK